MVVAALAGAIVSVLMGTGLVMSATALSLGDGVPTVDQMHQYDALLVGGAPPTLTALLGNRLYEFVNQGGGVVTIRHRQSDQRRHDRQY